MTSGVAGEISESQAVISHIRGAREEEHFKKNVVLKAIKVHEQHKLEALERLIAQATACTAQVIDGSDDDSKNRTLSHRKQAKRSVRYGQVNNDEMVCFTEIFKKFDADRLCIERDHLAFEREKDNNKIRLYHEECENRRAEAEKDRAGVKEAKKLVSKGTIKFKIMVDIH